MSDKQTEAAAGSGYAGPAGSDNHYASLGRAMAAHGKMLTRVPSQYERRLEIHVGQLTALLYALVHKMGGKADVFMLDEVQMPTGATIRWARDGFGTIRIECSPNK